MICTICARTRRLLSIRSGRCSQSCLTFPETAAQPEIAAQLSDPRHEKAKLTCVRIHTSRTGPRKLQAIFCHTCATQRSRSSRDSTLRGQHTSLVAVVAAMSDSMRVSGAHRLDNGICACGDLVHSQTHILDLMCACTGNVD